MNSETKKKKNWTRFNAQVAASRMRHRVGRGCGGHFASSVHPRLLIRIAPMMFVIEEARQSFMYFMIVVLQKFSRWD